MRHAPVAACVFLALGLTMATGAYAQTKSTNCGHPTAAEAGGGNGGKAPQYAEAGGGNGGRASQYAQAGGANATGAPRPAEAAGGNGGQSAPWRTAAASPCP
jgi:hypothetical protein